MATKTTPKVCAEVIDLTKEQAIADVGFQWSDDGKYKYKIGDEIRRFDLTKNKANRQFRIPRMEKHLNRLIMQVWAGQKNHPSKTGNGDSIVINNKDLVDQGAHRMAALILVNELIENDPDYYKEEFQLTSPVVMKDVVRVTCTDPRSSDTLDTHAPRDLGDVLYRQNEFGKFQMDGKKPSESMMGRLNRELATAIRLCQLRLNGQRLQRGPAYEHSQSLAFFKRHPMIKLCLEVIWELNNGFGKDGKRISNFISVGHAAGLMYLQSISDEPEDFDGTSGKGSRWEEASEFWRSFAEMDFENREPVRVVYKRLTANLADKTKGHGGLSRDSLCSVICRGFLAMVNDTDVSPRTIGTFKGNELVRLGGPDRELKDETIKEFGDFKLNMECWVLPEEEENDEEEVTPWKCKIVAFAEEDGVMTAEVRAKAGRGWSKESYIVDMELLSIEEPVLGDLIEADDDLNDLDENDEEAVEDEELSDESDEDLTVLNSQLGK